MTTANFLKRKDFSRFFTNSFEDILSINGRFFTKKFSRTSVAFLSSFKALS